MFIWCFSGPSLVANIERVNASVDILKKNLKNIPSADELVNLIRNKANEEKTLLDICEKIDNTFLTSVVKMQSAIIGVKAKNCASYGNEEIMMLSNLLECWPNDLSQNKDFHQNFLQFYATALNYFLDDVRTPIHPSLILEFIASHPTLFPKETMIELFKLGIQKCKKNITETAKHNLETHDPKYKIEPKGPSYLKLIKSYISRAKLEDVFIEE